jgi:histone-lysine N-methyltransferase SUV39H
MGTRISTAEVEPVPIDDEDCVVISSKCENHVRTEPEKVHKVNANSVGLMAGKGGKRKRVAEDRALEGDEPEYEVERIVDHRKVQNGRIHYLVKWKDWPKESNTWEPEENLTNCKQMLINYNKKFKLSRLGSASIGSPMYEDVEKFKSSLGCPTKQKLESLMLTYSRRGCLDFPVPKENDIDSKILRLLELPEDRRDPRLIEEVRNDLLKREFHFKRQEQLRKLKVFEMEMNLLSPDMARIRVENLVDLEEIPTTFTYVNDYIPGEGITMPDDPPVWCDCQPACSPDSGNCCPKKAGATFAYGPEGRLIVPVGTPIYECNKRCKCDNSCLNRVVQKGQKLNLCVFRTPNNCGWGVKALQGIQKGTFVCEYVGEVIKTEEAEKRGKVYDAEGRTYLFDLDFNDLEQVLYTVDAATYGNISHFINHSCEPNLAVFAVWINCLDPNLPKLALFATRNIKEGEEITFDYMSQCLRGNSSSGSECSSPLRTRLSLSGVENSEECLPGSSELVGGSVKKTHCKCGSRKCRKYLF